MKKLKDDENFQRWKKENAERFEVALRDYRAKRRIGWILVTVGVGAFFVFAGKSPLVMISFPLIGVGLLFLTFLCGAEPGAGKGSDG